MAAPSWAWIGTTANGSIVAADPGYHATAVLADDVVFCAVVNKASSGSGDPPVIATPSGWTEVATGAGGTGTAGAGTGPVRLTIIKKDVDADGTENGVVLTDLIVNPSGSSMVFAILFGLRRATAGTTISTASSGAGSDTSADTTFSVTTASDPGITVDDFLVTLAGYDLNTVTSTLETITAAGATIGTVTERGDHNTGAGFVARRIIWTASCTAGTATAAPVVGATQSAAATGAALVLRVREISAVVPPPTPLIVSQAVNRSYYY